MIGEAFLVEELAEHIAHAHRRAAACAAPTSASPRGTRASDTTPVTGLPTQELIELIGIAAASERVESALVGVEAPGINACPARRGSCAAGPGAALDAGFDEGDVERILELVPLATHNQRGRGTLYVGTQATVNAEQLVELVEGSMSAPVYALLKRPDELFVVEHAHLQPRFVEDSVRDRPRVCSTRTPELNDCDFVLSRQVNLETIHDHDVLAERYGTVGELRRELDTASPLQRHTSSTTGWAAADLVTVCHWVAASIVADVCVARCRLGGARGSLGGGKGSPARRREVDETHRPRLGEEKAQTGSESAATIDATDA